MFFMSKKKLQEMVNNVTTQIRQTSAEELAAHKEAVSKAAEEAIQKSAEELIAHKKAISDSVDKAIEDKIQREKQARYDSEEPFIELIGESSSDDKTAIGMRFDWNKAFIRKLKMSGYKASTDEQYIELWLSTLSDQIRADIGTQSFVK